jgi:hypothetical protein
MAGQLAAADIGHTPGHDNWSGSRIVAGQPAFGREMKNTLNSSQAQHYRQQYQQQGAALQ